MRLPKTLFVIAPESALRELPRRRLADHGVGVAGISRPEDVLHVAEALVPDHVLLDARFLDDAPSLVEQLAGCFPFREVAVTICEDCASWRELEPLL